MKLLPLLLLTAAAAGLGYIAYSAPEPDYELPVLDVVDQVVPVTLSGELPEGYAVRRYAVENMCKDCCPPAVYAAIRSEHDVLEAAVDMESGFAEVLAPVDFDESEMLARLARRNYPSSRAD